MSTNLLRTIEESRDSGLSFCLFRLPSAGKRVLWQITNTCNYTCSYCVFSSGPFKPEGELNTAEMVRVLSELQAEGFTEIKFTGGEPFVRKDVVDILRAADNLRFTYDLSTNASLITSSIASALTTLTGLTKVHVSIDGASVSTHETVRGCNTFAPSMRGLQELRKANIPVRIGAVVSKANENELEALCQLAAAAGAERMVFSFLEKVGRMQGDGSLLPTRSANEIGQELTQLQTEFSGKLKIDFTSHQEPANNNRGCCPGGTRFIFITNQGEVSPCSWLNALTPRADKPRTLKTHSLSEILHAEEMERHLTRINTSSVGGCPLTWRSYARAA